MELIEKQDAIEALKAIRHGLWEIDIPHPGNCPEYVEHHRQIKDMMEITDGWIKRLTDMPAVVTERMIDAPSGSAEDRKDTFVISLPPIQDPDLFVKEIIQEAIDAIKRCVDETHDMKTLLTLVKLCKLIAGDKFEAILEVNCDEEHTVGPE